jgi:hypothetical protein
VGNLSFNTTREALEAAFASAGYVREVAMLTAVKRASHAGSPS